MSTYAVHWTSTALRIKDPAVSLPFYEKNFGMKLVDKIEGDSDTRYFLARPRDADAADYSDAPGSPAAREKLFSILTNYVELWHKRGVEADPSVKYDNGNNEPNRGFGHLAFSVADVYASCARLEEAGVAFQKKPDEGRMKGLAFIKDPDSYWIEIVARAADAGFAEEFNLSQTMLRVRDPARSLAFYCGGALRMRLLCARHFADFSLYFLMSVPRADAPLPGSGPERDTHMRRTWRPILELTHNHGTEQDAEFKHHTGNTEPLGFSSVGFVTEDLEDTCALLKHDGAAFADAALSKELGAVPGKLEVVLDPDGYAVKLIAKGAQL
ncbi:putative lactoylglutathione lyase [Tribonema minus]|uniref:Aldoketomutase n=1 Tax=Tribonema minus TaxID=303371 RepID=A0A835ZDG3_9STRA|nr:putative lactoylglutathione lyase [Tribonema minus]